MIKKSAARTTIIVNNSKTTSTAIDRRDVIPVISKKSLSFFTPFSLQKSIPNIIK
jgi:hypothetical protein